MLVGILAMGFIFDRLGTKSDTEQLQKLLVRNVRMLAQLGVCPVVRDGAIAVSQISRLRTQINDNFASLNRRRMQRGLSLSFAIVARKTLPSVSGFRELSHEAIRLLQKIVEDYSSPNSRAITDICQKMVSSLLMLRNER